MQKEESKMAQALDGHGQATSLAPNGFIAVAWRRSRRAGLGKSVFEWAGALSPCSPKGACLRLSDWLGFSTGYLYH